MATDRWSDADRKLVASAIWNSTPIETVADLDHASRRVLDALTAAGWLRGDRTDRDRQVAAATLRAAGRRLAAVMPAAAAKLGDMARQVGVRELEVPQP